MFDILWSGVERERPGGEREREIGKVVLLFGNRCSTHTHTHTHTHTSYTHMCVCAYVYKYRQIFLESIFSFGIENTFSNARKT